MERFKEVSGSPDRDLGEVLKAVFDDWKQITGQFRAWLDLYAEGTKLRALEKQKRLNRKWGKRHRRRSRRR